MTLNSYAVGGEALRLPERPTAFGRYVETAVYALLAAFFVCVAVVTLRGVLSSALMKMKLSALALALTLLMVSWGMCRAVKLERALLVGILALGFVLRVWYVFAVPTQPMSDFALLYSSAQQTASGDMSWANVTEGYFSWWQYQIPFVLYEALIIKLTHSLAALKLMNVLWSVGINYLIYRLAARCVGRRCALSAAFIYAVYPGQLMMTSVLTNQHISMFFLLLGAVMLLEARSLWLCALAGVFFALGNLMRPEAILVIAAVCCVGLCVFVERPSGKALSKLLITLTAVILCYAAFQKAAELVLGALGYAPYGIGNSVPEWKLIVGLDAENGGMVTDKYIYLLNIPDPVERAKAAEAVISGHISNHAALPQLFASKLLMFWTIMDDAAYMLCGVNSWEYVLGGITIENMVYTLNYFELAVRCLAYLLAALSCVMLARAAFTGRGRRSYPGALFAAAVLWGTALSYLIIEVQPRYRYFAMPFVFILAACAFECVQTKPLSHLWKK